jgi:hypothetical protein
MDVPGYNGIYQASTLGNIRSHRKNNGVELLKPSISRGYLQVVLYNKGTSKTRKVHRCIMETFCGISKQECNHINGIRTDNRIDNLEYCTRSENQKHAYKINSEYRNKVRGENNKHSKLTLGDIELIKKLKGVRSQVIVAKYFNVTQACISLIQNNKTWANT